MVLAVHWSVGNVDDFLTMRHSLASSTSGTVDYITNGEDPGLKTDNLYLSRKSRDTSDRAAGETVYLLASSQHTLYDIRVYLLLCVQCYSWWWTEELSETCRVLFQKQIWEISASLWFYYKNNLMFALLVKYFSPRLWDSKVQQHTTARHYTTHWAGRSPHRYSTYHDWRSVSIFSSNKHLEISSGLFPSGGRIA